jgi:hypothetical protein
MIIRRQTPKGVQSKFIQVDFSLPCGKFPEWWSSKPTVQKFHLTRQRNCDQVLARNVGEEQSKAPPMPLWKFTLGSEHEALPFGEVVPCYNSVDLLQAPVL